MAAEAEASREARAKVTKDFVFQLLSCWLSWKDLVNKSPTVILLLAANTRSCHQIADFRWKILSATCQSHEKSKAPPPKILRKEIWFFLPRWLLPMVRCAPPKPWGRFCKIFFEAVLASLTCADGNNDGCSLLRIRYSSLIYKTFISGKLLWLSSSRLQLYSCDISKPSIPYPQV